MELRPGARPPGEQGIRNQKEGTMNTALRWTPFRKVDELFNAWSPLFERLPYAPTLASNEPELGFMPVTDIHEAKDEYIVKMDLPGVPKEDVKVLVENDMLVIKGERKVEHKERDIKGLRTEITYGMFERSFGLPEVVDAKAIRAEFKDGVLRVFLPKLAVLPKVEPVAIKVA
jgi:HSP20 family protein